MLAKLQNLIVSDILPNATTAQAHYLLPGCAHAEKRGSFINAKGLVQRFEQAINAKGNSIAEWEFLRVLAGFDGGEGIEAVFDQMAQSTPSLNGVTWAKLGERGVAVQI